MNGLHGHGHIVVTDCYFLSMQLVADLAALGMYSIGIVMSNRIGLPKSLAQKQQYTDLKEP